MLVATPGDARPMIMDALDYFALSFTSSYGPENGKPVMSPSPDSSTRDP